MFDNIRTRAKIMGYATILVGIIISVVSVILGIFGMLSFENGGKFALLITITIPVVLICNLVAIVRLYNKTKRSDEGQEELSKDLIKELGLYFKVQAIIVILLIFVYVILPTLLFT
jgi:Na+/melibiose symporter-like transporter